MAAPGVDQKPGLNGVSQDQAVTEGASQSLQLSRSASAQSNDSFKSASSSQAPPTSTSTTLSAIQPQSQNTGPTKIPLTGLSPKAKIPSPPSLSPQQNAMYAQVLAAVSAWTTMPESTARGAKNLPVTDAERMWLSRECLLRYLRATKWKVPDALKRLQGTLVWRREYGADTFTADYISPENETGKQVIQGYDNEGRPCLYLSPGKQNTKMSDRQIHHLSFMLDRTLDMLPPGQETTCLLINFKGAASGTVPTVGQAKAVLNILQNHNPERLGRALITDRECYIQLLLETKTDDLHSTLVCFDVFQDDFTIH